MTVQWAADHERWSRRNAWDRQSVEQAGEPDTNGHLLQDVRYPDALIYVHDTYPAVTYASVSAAKYVALREGNRSLEAHGLDSMLHEVSPTDPGALLATCLGVLAIAALASLVPAMRALRVDPAVALRAE